MPKLIEKVAELQDLYQDVILALGADLETGSHNFNNLAAEKFAKDFPFFMEKFNELGKKLAEIY